ncbi:MAG: O-antigen ligase family protein [Candidatus Doudnabacteria bacterium]|nr:O-antigen ligase family protein [Candidatus Doudnabacteria bacterium]
MGRPITKQPVSIQTAAVLSLILLSLLPLVYFPGTVINIAYKYFFFGLVTTLLGLFTAWTWIRASWIPRQLFRSWLSYGLISYLASFLLASVFSVDKAASFWSSFHRTDGAFTIIFCSIFAINIFTLLAIKGKSFLYQVFSASVIGATLLSILIMFTSDRGTGWFSVEMGGATVGNSSLAAPYVIWNIFFGMLLLIYSVGKFRRILWGLSTLAMILSPLFINWHFNPANGLMNIIGTARAGQLAIICGMVVTISFWFFWQTSKAKKYIGAALLSSIILGAVIVGTQLLNPASKLHNYFISVADENRFIFWDIAFKAFREKPILGWGPYTFNIPYNIHFNPRILTLPKPEILVDHTHNILIESLATGGIILFSGLIFFLTTLIIAQHKAVKAGRLSTLEGSIIIGGFAGWFLQAQFVFDSLVSLTMLFLVAAVTYSFSNENASAKDYSEPTTDRKVVFGIYSLASLILLIYGIFLPFGKANFMSKAYETRLPKRADLWEHFDEGSPMGNGYDTFLIFDQLRDTYDKNIETLRKDKPESKKIIINELDESGKFLYNTAQEKRYGFEYNLIGAKLYYLKMSFEGDFDGQDFERTIFLANKAIELSPTHLEAYWVAARAHFAAKNYEESKRLLEKAVELEPKAELTHILILNLAKSTKDQAYYDLALERAKKNIPDLPL